MLLWTAIQAVLFFTTYVQYQFDPNYSNIRFVFGYGLAVVRWQGYRARRSSGGAPL